MPKQAVSPRHDRFVVKVQISIVSSEPLQPLSVLVYNRDRSICQELQATRQLILLVGPTKKAYMWAFMEGTTLKLDGYAFDQDW